MAVPPSLPPNLSPVPSLLDIYARTYNVFGIRPCLWQIKVTETLLQGGKDIICIAGTGMGKTLTFWMPLLFQSGGIQIVVTLLNLLGKQNVASLARAGIWAIAISSETMTPANFQVSYLVLTLNSSYYLSKLAGNSCLPLSSHCGQPWADYETRPGVWAVVEESTVCVTDN